MSKRRHKNVSTLFINFFAIAIECRDYHDVIPGNTKQRQKVTTRNGQYDVILISSRLLI